MKCEFCREEVADDALVCPHCRRDTRQGRTKKGATRGKIIVVVVVAPLVLFLLMAALGSQLPDRTPSDRIAEACDREYPPGSEGNFGCKIALAEKTMNDIEKDKIERAARSAGVKP